MAEESGEPGGKKGVVFRDSIEQVKRISRYSNYTLDEVTAYWGDSDEHHLRKQELREAVHDWQQGRRMSDNMTFSTRGIADKIGEGKARKKENRAMSRNAVMDEQELQESEGARDDELLADIYTVTTISAKTKAHREALDMAAEVKMLNEDLDSS